MAAGSEVPWLRPHGPSDDDRPHGPSMGSEALRQIFASMFGGAMDEAGHRYVPQPDEEPSGASDQGHGLRYIMEGACT